ncbi:tetratricopeptide repeat family protein [Asticcacaulis biprosthecium C19]|uniref:protein O-GlcNAc transferase n=1 Tax=Asticcacaulis biprosthecium C19 TaxID=715226 RepID=F4QRQ6_9CAUL|nr:tetratricopeptide repeat protein [Asticcacaulis biprosthecium]EGF89426.1 tetratricopeptide repeat family protein [Asticcacaulis biprosthecium C19]
MNSSTAGTASDSRFLYMQGQQQRAAGDGRGALDLMLQAEACGSPSPHLLTDIGGLYLKLRDFDAAAQYLARAIAAGNKAAVVYKDYAFALLESGDHAGAEAVLRPHVTKGKDLSLMNLMGVTLKRQGRLREALDVLLLAHRKDPRSIMPVVNLGNVYFDLEEAEKAEAMFLKATQLQPKEGEYFRLLGRTRQQNGKSDQAVRDFRMALGLSPGNLKAVSDLIFTLTRLNRTEEAHTALDRYLRQFPNEPGLLLSRADLLRRTGKTEEAIAAYNHLLPLHPNHVDGWMGFGNMLLFLDREKANSCFAKAISLDGGSLRALATLCDSLNASRYGNEAAHIQASYDLALDIIRRYPQGVQKEASRLKGVLVRCLDYAATERLGPPKDLYDAWQRQNNISAFHAEMARVVTLDDRLRLLGYHTTWGNRVSQRVASNRIDAKPRGKRDKIRVGFMSSDLRNHPVTYFALPLLDSYDRERFEVYCYSFYEREADGHQRLIADTVDHFRLWPKMADVDVARGIAADELDILFELGGSTAMNKIEVMAYRPAPVQVSWLGYPHSIGLPEIDYILVDPYINPPDTRLLAEKPFELPETWVTLGRQHLFTDVAIESSTPEDRNGVITFGTANNPLKYGADAIAAWAKILNRVPGSRFLFLRPEGDVPAFRANAEKLFAEHGVTADRIAYIAIRGNHLPHYNQIDIALDPFPHTGGTTTCEALWMGVPTITLVGAAFFERISYSNLSNTGLADLCTFTVDDYIETAVTLAGDRARRQDLRQTLRQRIADNPLGQAQRFVDNFYAKVAEVVAEVVT